MYLLEHDITDNHKIYDENDRVSDQRVSDLTQGTDFLLAVPSFHVRMLAFRSRPDRNFQESVAHFHRDGIGTDNL